MGKDHTACKLFKRDERNQSAAGHLSVMHTIIRLREIQGRYFIAHQDILSPPLFKGCCGPRITVVGFRIRGILFAQD